MYRHSKYRKPEQYIDGSNHELPDSAIVNLHGNVRRTKLPGKIDRDVPWSELRRQYIIGKVEQLEDGSWVTKDYDFKEIAEKYNITPARVYRKAKQEGWRNYRQAYLARIDELSLGEDLGLYNTVNYFAEAATLQACKKLASVVDSFIESKYGDILDVLEDTSRELDEEDREEIASKVDIKEFKEATDVIQRIYKMQRDITDNSPEALRAKNNDGGVYSNRKMSKSEREQLIKKLENKFSISKDRD